MLILLFSLLNLFAQDLSPDKYSFHSVKYNEKARLLKVKGEFANIKYLVQGTRLEIWNPEKSLIKCKAWVRENTMGYLLLDIQNSAACINKIYLQPGSYLMAQSEELVKNLEVGKQAMEVMAKRRLILTGERENLQKELDAYTEKIEMTNKKFQLAREQIELEYKKEIGELERSRIDKVNTFQDLAARLEDLEFKMKRYEVEDQNFKTDRWSIDPTLHSTK
jgi:hypothetical protein